MTTAKRLQTWLAASILMAAAITHGQAGEAGWVSLFDGKSLQGWKANENPNSFRVEDGAIRIQGTPKAHLFYTGDVANHDFKDFELKLEVKTEEGANGGLYFHTQFQDSGWPAKGFEAQINATHKDKKKGGGLYSVVDVNPSPAPDNVWWTYHIIVKGSKVTLKVNGETTVEWTQPEGWKHPQFADRRISSGTFALQAHDPQSVVHIRNIRVRPL